MAISKNRIDPYDLPSFKALRPVAIWLYLCAASIFIMAIIGAITRLTGSGLSMVEWRPLMGAIPPLNLEEWNRVFELYKATPQAEKVNLGFSLNDFKSIFFWEWLHRFWGRLIGVLYGVPFLFFLIRGQLPKIYLPSFWGLLLLGSGQGFMGWYMVQSGLIDIPSVSHYRLAAHLGLAFLLYGLLLHLAFKLSLPFTAERDLLSPLCRPAKTCLAFVAITMCWGVFVAGLDAGLLYSAPQVFPFMGENLWPNEAFDLSPLWMNIFENPAMVQFTHRILACITLLLTLNLTFKSRHFNKASRIQTAFTCLTVLICLQFFLGLMTLFSNVALPLAVGHQAGAALTLATLIWILHEIPAKTT